MRKIIKKGIQYILCLVLVRLFIPMNPVFDRKYLVLHIVLSIYLFLTVIYTEKVVETLHFRKRSAGYMGVYTAILFVSFGVIICLAGNEMIMQYQEFYLAVVTAGVLLSVTAVWMLKMKVENQEEDISEEVSYEKIKTHRQQISFLRHDMVNRIQTASEMEQEGKEADALIQEIKQEVGKLSIMRYCEHPVVDITVTQKIFEMQERGIYPDVDIRLVEVEGFDYVLICNLVNLLFDHAKFYVGGENRVRFRLYNDKKFHGRNRIYLYMSISTERRKFVLQQNQYIYQAKRLVRSAGGNITFLYEHRMFSTGCIFEIE